MRFYMMPHVNQPYLLHSKAFSKTDGMVNRLMTGMLLMSKTIYHHILHTSQILHILLWDGLHISDISKILNAETYNRQSAMHHTDWHNLHIPYFKRHMRLNLQQIDGWHTRITLLLWSEAIRYALHQMISTKPLRIHIHITKHTEGTQVIQSTHMIIMFMRDQRSIQRLEIHTQHLSTEIRTTIKQDALVSHVQQA